MQQYIAFVLEKQEFAVPIMRVQEIIKIPQITQVPNAPYYSQGISNLRGKIVPIVNLKRLLNLSDQNEHTKVVVVNVGKTTLGLLIDEISGVINVEESQIETNIVVGENGSISGIAKLSDTRLVSLLNLSKLIPELNEIEEIVEIVEKDTGEVEVIKELESMGGKILVKEVVNAAEFYRQMGISKEDQRYSIVEDIISFMDAVANNDFEKADKVLNSLIQKGQQDLFKEIGKVAKKLNTSLKSFKEALDPKLKEIAVEHMPRAVDQLQAVIDRTEEAASKTLNIVEKYILKMDDLANHIRGLQGPPESVEFLREFKNSLEDDLTEILTTQSFQDLTGQTIKRVIKLVDDLEIELLRLITTFGLKVDEKQSTAIEVEKVSQEDIDSLLEEFGF